MSHLDLSSSLSVKIDFSDCPTVKALLSSFISLLSLKLKLQIVLLFSAFLVWAAEQCEQSCLQENFRKLKF